ncbi:hypothetical protein [Streptosporangium lutulentum]|uniref:Uncharacterized protein n=1 Tax=Streptosporangium lutulentum TaxID=1461250 RepID=A0ABT9QPK4_9ACTN|nr:hypothetical protein [Streptosporangium lutulentum]MDP9848193.1 hypothetical protein [Streptosporangium lutulentum]
MPVSLAVLLAPGCGRIEVTPGEMPSRVPSVQAPSATVMSIPSPPVRAPARPMPAPSGNLPPERPVAATASARLDTTPHRRSSDAIDSGK